MQHATFLVLSAILYRSLLAADITTLIRKPTNQAFVQSSAIADSTSVSRPTRDTWNVYDPTLSDPVLRDSSTENQECVEARSHECFHLGSEDTYPKGPGECIMDIASACGLYRNHNEAHSLIPREANKMFWPTPAQVRQCVATETEKCHEKDPLSKWPNVSECVGDAVMSCSDSWYGGNMAGNVKSKVLRGDSESEEVKWLPPIDPAIVTECYNEVWTECKDNSLPNDDTRIDRNSTCVVEAALACDARTLAFLQAIKPTATNDTARGPKSLLRPRAKGPDGQPCFWYRFICSTFKAMIDPCHNYCRHQW